MRAHERDDTPTWVIVLIVVVFSAVMAWQLVLDVGRMGFFWGWWGR